MSVKERMSREKLMLAPSTEELLTIDRPIQVNGKAGKARQKMIFVHSLSWKLTKTPAWIVQDFEQKVW